MIPALAPAVKKIKVTPMVKQRSFFLVSAIAIQYKKSENDLQYI
jgi:hypothetical protein